MSAITTIQVVIQDKRSGTTASVTGTSNWTVEQLKKAYAEQKQNAKFWNSYTFYGTTAGASSSVLHNPDLLSKHGVVNGTRLNALYEEPKLPVQVRGLDGRTTKIAAFPSWTVRRLKEEYARWLGEGWDNVVLLYKAKRLKDEDLLAIYKIEPDGFVQANVRSVGGDEK